MDTLPWKLAEQFGWTLEYINSLTIEELAQYEEYLATNEGLLKAKRYIARTRPARNPEG
jgi:hypothetical protein